MINTDNLQKGFSFKVGNKNYFQSNENVPPVEPNYFYIINNSTTDIAELYISGNSNKTFEYSYDESTWYELDSTEMPEIYPEQKLFLRGENETISGVIISCTQSFSVGGDITTLLENNGNVLKPERNVFSGLFMHDPYGANLVDASELILPATTLAESCYTNMFNQCFSLTTAPELPATTLAPNCYESMFSSCSSLTTAPELPATTLAPNCYYGMFYGCMNLNKVTTYATNWNTDYTMNWLSYTFNAGYFYNLGDANIPTNNPSGIPTGWTEYSNF